MCTWQSLFASCAPDEFRWLLSSRYEASCEPVAGWGIAQLAVLVSERVLNVQTKFGAHFLALTASEIRVQLQICC